MDRIILLTILISRTSWTENFDVEDGPKAREKWLAGEIEEINKKLSSNNRLEETSSKFSIVPCGIFPSQHQHCDELLLYIGRYQDGRSYSGYLLENKEFREFAKLSIHNASCNEFFSSIIQGQS